MTFKHSVYLLFIFILCIVGCAPEKVSLAEFSQQVINDKAYKKEQQAGDYYVKMRYLPPELIALMELSKAHSGYVYNKAEFEAEVKNYSNGFYVELTIGLKDGTNIIMKGVTDQSAYAARIGTITYKLTDDFYVLTAGNEKIKALNCTFSNTYGNSPEAKMIFVFPKTVMEKGVCEIKFIYDDHCFGINQQLVFNYKTSILTKPLPVLND